MKKLIEKANILIEALPYIQEFSGKTFVIKYGGAAQTEDHLKDSFAQDTKTLLSFIRDLHLVIVHGEGPKISSTMEKMGETEIYPWPTLQTKRSAINLRQ